MTQVKYRGLPVEVSPEHGDKWIVPPLNARQLRESVEELKAHDAVEVKDLGGVQERRKIELVIIHRALTRNYPNISLDDVEDELDARTIPQAFKAAIGLSDTWVKEVGESSPVKVVAAGDHTLELAAGLVTGVR